jgi:prepilin-type N-terminal cleavage/methylation domain-containing protein
MKKRAFTLPEMLVVLGIIAILIAILLPVLHKARELANQATCMSHLRQIGQATLLYVADNDGIFPGNGNGISSGVSDYNPNPPAVPYADWIYWIPAPAATTNNDVTQSPVAKYLNLKDGTVFTCPSDSGARVLPFNTTHGFTYAYSYSMNTFLGNGPDFRTFTHRNISRKLAQVNRAAMVIIFICEDERTVNDGAWSPTTGDTLASRHDGQKDLTDQTARGNVIFVDGHGEFITRALSATPSSYQPFYPTILPRNN